MNNYSNTNNYWINKINMNALLFPGQGSQSIGMGADLYKNFDLVKNIFKEADEILNR